MLVALLALPVASWSAGHGETRVDMDQLPPAVKATIQKESAGAHVGTIDKETEGGRTFYEVEIGKGGRGSYLHVAENGKVLKRESAAQERRHEGAEHH
jgi:hypothetical protein